MELWKVILIALGSIAAGLLVGLLVIYLLQRQKAKNLVGNDNFVSTVTVAKQNPPTDDPLEILIKNHKNTTPPPVQIQSVPTEISKSPDLFNSEKAPQAIIPNQPLTNKNPDVSTVTPRKPKSSTEKKSSPSRSDAVNFTHVAKQTNKFAVAEKLITPKTNDPRGSEIPSPKNSPITKEPQKPPVSDFIKELDANLKIATTPWTGKLLPFQTKFWESGHGEDEPRLASHHQDLIQIYVDISLANNIVWLFSEMGHTSKELNDSYVKLCSSIAERLKMVMAGQTRNNPI